MSSLQFPLEELARSGPDSLALVRDATRYTFSEFNGLANQVAQELTSKSIPPRSIAAVWSADPAMQIILTFGVWKAGLTAVILDTRDSQPRLQWILDNAGATIAVADTGSARTASELASAITVLAFDPGDSSATTATAPELELIPDTPALIMYTSGSEGRPKGVVKLHQDVLLDCRYHASDLELSPEDRLVQLFPLNFASGLKQALTAVFTGSPVYFFDLPSHGLEPFYDWFRQEEITVMPSPVGLLRRVLHHSPDSDYFARCRYVVVNGERLFKRDIHTFRRVFPKSCKLLYSYGATECGNISRHVIQEDTPVEDPIPVGRPPGDKELRFFRTKREAYVELPAGESGEIAVISSNLSSSYWSDPEMTEWKYRPLPGDDGKRMYMTGDFGRIGKDNLLYLYNRNDRQLKIHGFRVDLSEIEAVLNNDEHVTHAVVVTAEDSTRDPRLIAYVALSGDSGEQEVLLRRVKKAATTRLPSYMLPHQYVILDVMPTTHRGKVDQQALTAMPLATEREDEEIVSETEKTVIEVWRRIFERDHVSLDDDILELGVTSLLGMEMCLVLGRKFSIEVPYTQLASCPTPRQLSAFIDSKLA